MDTVKPMALSTAIRLGAMLRPQSFGRLFSFGGSCAWGAAHEAIGRRIACWEDMPTEWTELWRVRRECPAEKCGTKYTTDMVAHLNDFHYWTREQIADWVETLETLPELREATMPAETPSALAEVET